MHHHKLQGIDLFTYITPLICPSCSRFSYSSSAFVTSHIFYTFFTKFYRILFYPIGPINYFCKLVTIFVYYLLIYSLLERGEGEVAMVQFGSYIRTTDISFILQTLYWALSIAWGGFYVQYITLPKFVHVLSSDALFLRDKHNKGCAFIL
jgi:hypothetical protein